MAIAKLGLASPQVSVDGINVLIVPDSFDYTEGFGITSVKPESGGGTTIVPVLYNSVADRYSTITFTVRSTAENIAFFRAIKSQDRVPHVVQFNEEGLNRTCTGAVITNNYTVGLKDDGGFDIEFMGSPVV